MKRILICTVIFLLALISVYKEISFSSSCLRVWTYLRTPAMVTDSEKALEEATETLISKNFQTYLQMVESKRIVVIPKGREIRVYVKKIYLWKGMAVINIPGYNADFFTHLESLECWGK